MNKYTFNASEHLHKLNGRPLTGTSSVIDVLAKPLTWWASGKAVETLGWLNPKKASNEEREKKAIESLELIKKMDINEYLSLLDRAYRAHKERLTESAEKGRDLHTELELFIKTSMGIMDVKEFDERIIPFQQWAKTNVEEFLFSEAHTYSEKLWVGGVIDAGVKLKDGSFAIIDFKSSKEAYPGHFIQTGGYALQVEETGVFNSKGSQNKKFDNPVTKLIVVPFGANPVLPVVISDVQSYKNAFEYALQLYRLIFNERKI